MPRPAELTSSNLESPPSRSALRIAAGVVLGLVLVVTVAVLAVGSGAEDSEVSVPQMGEPTEWFDITIAVLGALSVLVFVLVVVAAFADTRGSSEQTRLSRLIPGMFIVGGLMWFVVSSFEFDQEPVVIEEPAATPSTTLPDAGPASSSSGVDMGLVLAGGALVAAALAIAAWSIRRSRPADRLHTDETATQHRRDTLIGLLDDAIAQLRAHPDPREAVIATWSRLEVAFESVDIDRQPSDTPARYLAKVLGTVEASAPAVAHVTTTFERAMFSPTAIDRSDQQQAVDALVAVRDELQVLTRGSTRSGAR